MSRKNTSSPSQGVNFFWHPAPDCSSPALVPGMFLLGERKQPGGIHHLFVFAGIPESISGPWHDKSLHYALRSVDATTGGNKQTLFVYTKANRSLMFSPIVPASPHGWVNTRVHAGHGKIVSPQKIGDFFNSRIEGAFAQPLSERQQTRIGETMT